ncbi:MAG TPA: hypothetical protein VFX59_15105 [Polyangiales bacterium]|nr:hypothetical protein [Polyangiales bacterium]
MHTVMVIGGGLLLLGVFLGLGRALGVPLPQAALYFVFAWLVAAGVNMYIGVARAGYSVADEAPMFLIVFGVPAAIAFLLRWRLA